MRELGGWVVALFIVYGVVCFCLWLWKNEPDTNGFRPRQLTGGIVVGGGALIFLALWLSGAFQSPRERCARLASQAFPMRLEDASEQREWNRYFYRCLATNRKAGVDVD
jgi:hypothetical protein